MDTVFLILVFADVFAISSLKEHVSLDTLREAGIPVEEMEKAGMSPREMRLYLPFWQDMEYFPLAVRPQEMGRSVFLYGYLDGGAELWRKAET